MLPSRIQIALTKIIVPKRRADLLTRQRLLDMLDNMLDNRLTILSAPAGYGKTSLLVDMAANTGVPVCWYAIDRLDRDFSRFLTYLIHSIAQQFPAFGESSAAADQSSSYSNETLDRISTIISNDIFQNIREHFVIVLDDFHLVEDIEPINYFINRFIQQVDDNCHIVIASRTLAVFPDLPLLVAHSQVGGLSFDDLAFQSDEIKSLVLQNYHLTISDETADQLARDTEGWITALMLSIPSIWHGMSSRLQAAQVTGIGLYEYLAQQVLDLQTNEVKLFLQRTSFLEEFDANLCKEVLEPVLYPNGADWLGLMESITRNNLFVLPVGESGSWLRYHHLFTDFLQKSLIKDRPEEKDLIVRQLARIDLAHGEVEKAYELYQMLGDETEVARLVARFGTFMIQNGRLATLSNWLDALPNGVLTENTELLSLSGSVEVMQGNVKIGLALLDQADKNLRIQDDPQTLAANLVRRAVTHNMMGNYSQSLADANEAIHLSDQLNQQGVSIRAEALLPAGYCYYQLGQLDKSVKAIEESLALFHALKNEEREAQVYMELGLVYNASGAYSSSIKSYEQALNYFRKKGNYTWQANVQNNLGVFYQNRGEFITAYQHLESALECSRLSGYTRMEAFTLASIGDLYTSLDSLDAALEAYNQADAIAERIEERYLQLYILLAKALITLKQGHSSAAHGLIEAAFLHAKQHLSEFEVNLCRLTKTRILLGEGQPEQAVHELEQALKGFEKGSSRNQIALSYLFLAAAHQAMGKLDLASHDFHQSLASSRDISSHFDLISAIPEVKQVLSLDLADETDRRMAAKVAVQLNCFEHDLPSIRRQIRRQAAAIPFGLPKVNIHTLGKIQVRVDGKLVTTSDWQTQVARDLFLLLLSHPNGLTKEEIGLLFWPDYSSSQLKIQFKNTIYRLRRALGQNVILFENDLYRFNQELDYEADFELFLSRLTQVKKETEIHKKLKAWRQALDVYKGNFLPGLDFDWVLQIRENLWIKYQNSLFAYVEALLEKGEYQTAIEACSRLLTQDICQEDAYRLMMRAYSAQGNTAEVARQYERCVDALQRELNVEPSLKTQKLYRTLTLS